MPWIIYICRAGYGCGDAFGAGLSISAQHCAVCGFKFKFSKQSFNTDLERRVVSDGLGDVQAPNFFSFFSAEGSEEKEAPMMN